MTREEADMTARFVAVTLLVVVMLVGLAIYEALVWKECLRDQAWWYCLLVMG